MITYLSKLTAVDGVQNSTSVLQGAALATLGSTGTNPTSVEQPRISTVFCNLLRQHLSVACGVKSKERLSEARREGCLWLSDTHLGTSHLRSVSGDEVVHGLFGCELRDWWQDTASVASEEDDVCWVAVSDTGDLGVLDVLDGVSTTGVLCEGGVVVVDITGDGVEDDVLEDGTELDGVVNVGLLLGGEANALGVATTFDVEDTLV